MGTPLHHDRTGAPRTQWVMAEPVIAAVAAHAAGGVAGVVRLEPGLTGLASQVARSARQKINGLAPAPTEGVRVRTDRSAEPPVVFIAVDLVTSAQDQAAAMAYAVQREVTRAVADATGLTPRSVGVSITDIELYGSGTT
ncbi:Asp23/Gls24 family envelope stress response protein [Streptomyces sp. NPDC096193]|uniref:Asp23/Gls24 family envelope stress response protein n=1 Tax=Streptomyces sp. NPDC096193 TaxID=3155821 RepID=UPI003333E963